MIGSTNGNRIATKFLQFFKKNSTNPYASQASTVVPSKFGIKTNCNAALIKRGMKHHLSPEGSTREAQEPGAGETIREAGIADGLSPPPRSWRWEGESLGVLGEEHWMALRCACSVRRCRLVPIFLEEKPGSTRRRRLVMALMEGHQENQGSEYHHETGIDSLPVLPRKLQTPGCGSVGQ
jgi:hypothetical protein